MQPSWNGSALGCGSPMRSSAKWMTSGTNSPANFGHYYRDLLYLLPQIPVFFIVNSGNFYRVFRYVLSFQPVTARLVLLYPLLLQIGGSAYVGRLLRLVSWLLAVGFLLFLLIYSFMFFFMVFCVAFPIYRLFDFGLLLLV